MKQDEKTEQGSHLGGLSAMSEGLAAISGASQQAAGAFNQITAQRAAAAAQGSELTGASLDLTAPALPGVAGLARAEGYVPGLGIAEAGEKAHLDALRGQSMSGALGQPVPDLMGALFRPSQQASKGQLAEVAQLDQITRGLK